jgi:ribosomal subunit interface protein
MPFRVSGKNIDIGDALRQRVSERIAEALGKYFDGGYSGHATVEKDGFGFRTECAIHLDSGITLQAEANAADAYASADQAAMRIEKRLRRYKRRLKDRPSGRPEGGQDVAASSYVIEAPQDDAGDEAVDFNPVIIAESTTALRRLSVSEAVIELDLTGTAVMVFRHAGHGRVNIVYRRPDGHIGWIDPPAMDPAGGH